MRFTPRFACVLVLLAVHVGTPAGAETRPCASVAAAAAPPLATGLQLDGLMPVRLSPVDVEGYPKAYEWLASRPHEGAAQLALRSVGESYLLQPDVPGVWRVRLIVRYAHLIGPDQPYSFAADGKVYAGVLFADDFEDGNTAAW